MKRGCAFGCLGLIGFLVLLVSGVMYLTAPVVEAADAFLQRLGRRETQQAYQSTSRSYQAQTSPEEFTAAVQELGLDSYQSRSWNSRTRDNGQGSVSGSVVTSKGEIELVVLLSQEGSEWKVSGFRRP